MTIRSFHVNSTIGYGAVNDVYGGQEIKLEPCGNLMTLLHWWMEWQPVFSSMNPHVVEALQQAKVMHALSKDPSSGDIVRS